MVALRLRHSPHGLNIRSLNRQSWKDKLMSLFNHWLIYKHPLISKGCQLNSVIIVDKPSDHVSPFGSWLFLCSAWTRQTHLGGSTTQRLICRSRPLCSLEFQAAEEMVYQSRNLGLIISDQPIMLSYLFLFHISYINHIYIYILSLSYSNLKLYIYLYDFRREGQFTLYVHRFFTRSARRTPTRTSLARSWPWSHGVPIDNTGGFRWISRSSEQLLEHDWNMMENLLETPYI
jgi:hypothetical protein